MQNHPGGVDDREESLRRPGGEGGFRFSENKINRWQASPRVQFEARAGVIQSLAEGIQSKGASELRDQPRRGFGLKELFDGGKVTKGCHRG